MMEAGDQTQSAEAAETGTGTEEASDQPLEEGDVTKADGLDDRVQEGDGLPEGE